MAANETQRSRTAILAGLLVVLAVVLAYTWWPAASPAPAPSNQTREQRTQGTAGTPAAQQLAARLDDLQHQPPPPSSDDRNPFRFYVKPPPPPPPPPKPVVTAPPPQPGEQGYVPPPPPPPPPIPLKCIGILEKPAGSGKRWAIFSDGRGVPVWATEGEMVMGQWKLVRIGVESVVMEYPNGTGRQTIPVRGGAG